MRNDQGAYGLNAWHRPHRGHTLLLAAGLLILAALAHGAGVFNDFISYDDQAYVTQNAHVTGGVTRQALGWACRATAEGNWHPLVWLSHMLVVQVHGLDPFWHHFYNILLHGANAVLLFLFLQAATAAPLPSVLTAAVFAVHPLHVESVAWVSERKDVLCQFFTLLALLAYRRYATKRRGLAYGLTLLGQALALGAKPMAVSLPGLLLVLDFWPLQRFQAAPPSRFLAANRRLFLEKIPMALLSLAIVPVSLLAQQGTGALAPLTEFGIWQRLGTVLTASVTYLGKYLLPVGLAPLYPLPAHLPVWQAPACAIALAAITWLAARRAQSAPYLLAGWLWYLVTLLPVSGLVQVGIQAFADRYTYLPTIGLTMAAVWAVCRLARPDGPAWVRPVLLGLGAAGLGLWIGLARRQTALWADTITLFRHTVAVTRNNHMAHTVLGRAYLHDGRLRPAAEEFLTVARLRPHDAAAALEAVKSLVLLGETDQALRLTQTGLKQAPPSAALLKLAAFLSYRKHDWAAARQALEAALRLTPDDAEAKRHLALVRQRLATPGPAVPAP